MPTRQPHEDAAGKLAKVSAAPAGDRAAFMDGLLALACFLEAHPEALVPPVYDGTVILHVFPGGDTNDERRAAVDSIAAALGTTAAESRPGSGHYQFNVQFGPVTYRVLAIDENPADADLKAAV
jgi:hypothetical protein